MSTEREAQHARLIEIVDAMASDHEDGALLLLEAESSSMTRLRDSGATNEDFTAIFLEASRIANEEITSAASARTGWARFEYALRGPREALTDAARVLVNRLGAHPECMRLSWRAILTRIFPGPGARTHWCDPGYDLLPVKCSAVVWVEPYPGDDWNESQRYPAVTIIWRAA